MLAVIPNLSIGKGDEYLFINLSDCSAQIARLFMKIFPVMRGTIPRWPMAKPIFHWAGVI